MKTLKRDREAEKRWIKDQAEDQEHAEILQSSLVALFEGDPDFYLETIAPFRSHKA